MIKSNLDVGYAEIAINYGYYIDKVPKNVLNELKIQIDKLQNNFTQGKKVNSALAGEIKHEYELNPQPNLDNYLEFLTNQIEEKSKYLSVNYSFTSLECSSLWVNFQKKYEYNPIHSHDGAYSFVIWYQIPYYFSDEYKYHYRSPDGSKCNHGKFIFITPHLFSKKYNMMQYDLNIDKSYEGHIAIFPSDLQHQVYPFYSSDEYRITVSGNIQIIK